MLGGEMGDADRLVVFVDDEIFLPEAGHEAAARVRDGRGDVDQLDAALEAEALFVPAGPRWCRRLLPMQRHDEQRDGRRNDRQGVKCTNHIPGF